MSEKPMLLLLPGALGSSIEFSSWIPLLSNDYKVIVFDYPGHSNQPTNQDFSIPAFAHALQTFLDEMSFTGIHVFGFSMGGYIALWLQLLQPNTFTSIITLGTKYFWNKETGAVEADKLNPEIMEQKVPKYTAYLELLHGMYWKQVVHGTRDLMRKLCISPSLNSDVLKQIEVPVLVCKGDQDKMIFEEEVLSMSQSLPNGRMMTLPDTKHPLEKVNPELVVRTIKEFHSNISME